MDEENERNEPTGLGSGWPRAEGPVPPGQGATEDQSNDPEPPATPTSPEPRSEGARTEPAAGGGWTWASAQPEVGHPGEPRPGYPNAGAGIGGGWTWASTPPPSGYPGASSVPGPGWSWAAPPPPPPPSSPGSSSGAPWGYPPSAPYWVASSASQPRRHWGYTLTALVLAILIAMAAGFGVGRAAWRTSTSGGTTPTTLPSSGSGTSPFGSGGFSFGSGGSGSSGSSNSTATGGPADANAIASGVDPAVVDVNTTLGYAAEEAAGTGIVLSSTGRVLTNNHVIDGATTISVTDVGTGQVYSASVVGYDRSSDIAVLQLHGASGLKVASLGDSSKVHVGEAVVAIGNAGGVGGTPSVAGGSVTGLDQSITATEEDGGNPENLKGLLEVNSDIQPGDSGGPLVDTAGRVLGMDTAASAGFSFQTTGTQGYAIPINTAIAIAKKIESGQASDTIHIGLTGFLGVSVEPSSTGSAGAEIVAVEPSTPAASAGLASGDVITGINGKEAASPEALTTLLQLYHPGDRVHLQWIDYSGAKHSATLQLATGPAA